MFSRLAATTRSITALLALGVPMTLSCSGDAREPASSSASPETVEAPLPVEFEALAPSEFTRLGSVWGSFGVSHPGAVHAIAFSRDGRQLVSGGADARIRIWSVESGESLRVLDEQGAAVTALGTFGDAVSIVAGDETGRLSVFGPDGRLQHSLELHEERVNALAVRFDGARGLSAGEDGVLGVWDLTSGQLLKVLEEHEGPVQSVDISSDGRTAVSLGQDDFVRIWDVEEGSQRQAVHSRQRGPLAVAILPDATAVATVAEDGTIKIRDTETGRARATLRGSKREELGSIDISPDGKLLLVGSYRNSAQLWDVLGESELGRFTVYRGWSPWKQSLFRVNAVAFSPDATLAATASDDGRIRFWDVATRTRRERSGGHELAVTALAFSADGQRVLSTGLDGRVQLWSSSGERLRNLSDHEDGSGIPKGLAAVAFSPGAAKALAGGRDRIARIWDLEAGAVERELKWHDRKVNAVAYTADGLQAVTGTFEGVVRLWDVRSGELADERVRHDGSIFAIVPRPPGRFFVSGGSDGTLRVWAPGSDEEEAVLHGDGTWINALAVSGDGRFAVSGSEAGEIRIWDLELGQTVRTLEGHEEAVRAVALDPDAGRILSASFDGSVRIWDFAEGRELDRVDFSAVADRPRSLAVAPGGGWFLVGTDRGAILRFELGE
jgi:WD40 repeat protein